MSTIHKPADWAAILRDWATTGRAHLSPEGMIELAGYLEALDEVHGVLDGAEWDSETADTVAHVLRRAGMEIAPCDED